MKAGWDCEALDDVMRGREDERLPEWLVECLTRVFSAIADPTRVRILHALAGHDRLSVTELAEHTGLSVSAVSHQLRLLRDRMLLKAQREGRSVLYSLADEHIRVLLCTGIEHAYEDCTNNLRREGQRAP
jgi:ArsR family transcriptional regulator, lead/cadmium/zinc/bismuth-responsive transcriptional repressor